MLLDDENFENVIFTDETKIQMESNMQRQARKEGDQRYEDCYAREISCFVCNICFQELTKFQNWFPNSGGSSVD